MQLANLSAVDNQMNGFEKSLSDAVPALQDIFSGWAAMADDLSELVSKLDQQLDTTATQLHDTNLSWEVVLRQAMTLQPSGQIPVKQYEGVEGFLDDVTYPKQGT